MEPDATSPARDLTGTSGARGGWPDGISRLRAHSALAAVALLVGALLSVPGCDDAAGTTSTAAIQTTTTATPADAVHLSAEDQALLAEIRTLHDDWKSGKIRIDWPPLDADMAEPWIFGSLEERFQEVERAAFARQVVTAWLKDEAGTAEELRAEIAAWPEVAEMRFVSKDEALARLRADLADHADLLESLQGNPLPASIEITVRRVEAARPVGERLQTRPEVDEVHRVEGAYPYAAFLEWLRRLAHPAGTDATPDSDAPRD